MRAFVVVFIAACSSVEVDDVLTLDGSAMRPDATNGGFPDDASADAGAEATVFNGGGAFMCGNCICDGTLEMCNETTGHGGGPKSPIDDASTTDASACEPDASACKPIPIECLPKPSCACIIGDAGNCSCSVDPSGNGLVVHCIL
jgi:hypothetical protein